MNMEFLRQFFGWMTLINLALFIFTALMSAFCRGLIYKVHSRMFGLSEETTNKALYYFLAFYKIIFITFNLIPWLALTIMT
ncbi:DUF6868 family protein [Pontiella agarivorans]|uniref:DUF6868 domain-containing protein n=1 Tax=Pontiella agarivorans TaxID=3038953 RepID=A0ABU5N0L4_9BACT|nr:hypothetical protein [Pontiella agarivorans]MDZ8119970.1 hypothetical protein [Pontiella agarivorans]